MDRRVMHWHPCHCPYGASSAELPQGCHNPNSGAADAQEEADSLVELSPTELASKFFLYLDALASAVFDDSLYVNAEFEKNLTLAQASRLARIFHGVNSPTS